MNETLNRFWFLPSTVINAPINEPPLPRRKKCPELAYRHHEFIADSNADRTDSNVTRARVSLCETYERFVTVLFWVFNCAFV
jgi:hypothetical protein